jgi:hypothetical protein
VRSRAIDGRSRSRVPALLALTFLSFSVPSLQAQVSDALASHWGAARNRESTNHMWSLGFDILLLSQFDSRWIDADTPTYIEYKNLTTTVGYNYFSYGYQLSWPGMGFGNSTPVFAVSGVAGFTSDDWTRTGQDGLHDYRRYPHVQRPNPASGDKLFGVAIEASQWWSFHFWSIDWDVYPTAATTWGTHLQEASLSLGASAGFWKVRLQGEAVQGWFLDHSSIVLPAQIRPQLDDAYVRYLVDFGFDRTRFGRMGRYIPSMGVNVAFSSGHFRDEEEKLLSLYFDFPSAYPGDSVRLEATNDMLGGKDRGPTGGLRITYVGR